jgi:selenide, water dikinase
LTDVTGFGLLGHLTEMCEGSGLAAIIEFDKVPIISSIKTYLQQGCIPGGTGRNWNSYSQKISTLTDEQRHILADPQTSGGLLVAVEPEHTAAFEAALNDLGLPDIHSFGYLKTSDTGPLITVI